MATAEAGYPADDPLVADPKHFALEFENERVRVLRAKFGPREKAPMLGFPAMITVSVTDRDIKFTFPNGRTQRLFGRAGEVVWYEARRHQPENMSAKDYEGILILLKDSE
ncbi:MAG TPA: hypothetical protein VG028_16180 [Terriglobia bacterium]|nr:hypothetical protein [Terriglobia bacterium]